MTKKTEITQFKTPTKRPLGSTYTTPTPIKIKKVSVFSLSMDVQIQAFYQNT